MESDQGAQGPQSHDSGTLASPGCRLAGGGGGGRGFLGAAGLAEQGPSHWRGQAETGMGSARLSIQTTGWKQTARQPQGPSSAQLEVSGARKWMKTGCPQDRSWTTNSGPHEDKGRRVLWRADFQNNRWGPGRLGGTRLPPGGHLLL